MNFLKSAGLAIGALILICGILYGSYWVVKSVSYTIFYESMVEQTVREMVKPEYLIPHK